MKVDLPKGSAVVRFEDLPDSAEVTGYAMKDGGEDYLGDANTPTKAHVFRRVTVEEVKVALANISYDYIVLDDFRI